MLGRSNVGKSSLINALVGTRVARVSATPGKTRMMNVFVWDRGYLLDLPGYGYARASRTERAGFRRLLDGVLARPRLAGVVWLLDIRHEPSADDRAMREAFAAAGTRVLAALTKHDKLPRGQRVRRAGALRAAVALDEDQIVSTSARAGEGITELREAIAALLDGGPAAGRVSHATSA